METRPRSQAVTWLLVILAVLVLLPLLSMIGMMAMGGMMMGGTMMDGDRGGMGGMMGMHGWGVLWMVLLAAVLIGLIVLVIRGISGR